MKTVVCSLCFIPFAVGKKKLSFRGSGWKAISTANWSHDEWESEYLNQPTTAMQDMSSKGQDPKHPTPDTFQKPPKKICLGNETSQKKVIIRDEDDTEEANCSNNGSDHELSSAISAASTRAELAALATLIPPVSSFAGSLSPMLGQGAGSDFLFTNPFCVVQRPCQAVIERAEALLTDERKKETIDLVLLYQG